MLEDRLTDLEERLGRNLRNSSTPCAMPTTCAT